MLDRHDYGTTAGDNIRIKQMSSNNKEEKGMSRNPTQDEMGDLLMAAIFMGCEPNFNMILGSDQGAFHMRYKPQAELVRLLRANQERFIEILKSPVMIAADWGFGAKHATFRVIPADGDNEVEGYSREQFVTFTLPIPPDKPYAVMQ